MNKLAACILTFLLTLFLWGLASAPAFAGGPGANNTISVSTTSTTVGESVTVTVWTDPGSQNLTLPIYPSIISGKGSISPQERVPDSSGYASFTLTTSTAGTVTMVGCTVGDAGACYNQSSSVSVTFKAAPAPPPTPAAPSTPSPSKPTAKPTTPTTTNPTIPTAPTVSSVKVAGSTVSTSKSVTLAVDQPLDLAGKTIPDGIVTLTIHSTPRTVTATADSQGNWSYDVTGLAVGNHTIDATVMDPKSKQTSAQTQLLSFVVTAAKLTHTSTAPKPSLNVWPIVGSAVVLVLAIGSGGWYFWRRRKQAKTSSLPNQVAPNANDQASSSQSANGPPPPITPTQ